MNIFKKLIAFLRFREAVKQADVAHKKYNKRYYVLPMEGGKLVVTDRKNFRGLRQKHYIDKRANISSLWHRSLYHTPDGSGRGGVPAGMLRDKFNRYVDWLSQ